MVRLPFFLLLPLDFRFFVAVAAFLRIALRFADAFRAVFALRIFAGARRTVSFRAR